MGRWVFFGILGFLFFLERPASAQFERYELGRRLRAFEVLWDQNHDTEVRARASRSLKDAVNAFFAARQTDAARSITEAEFAIQGVERPEPDQRWAKSLVVEPSSRFLDASSRTLPVKIRAFYPVDSPRPEGVKLCLTLGGQSVDLDLLELPKTAEIPLEKVEPGDLALVAVVRRGDKTLATSRQTISLAKDLDSRLARLSKTAESWPKGEASIDRESARTMLGTLTSLARARTLESDFAAARLLGDLEAQFAAIAANRPYFGGDRSGQGWVTVPIKNDRTVVTRVFVPEQAAKGEPLPLVVALHGAGGSENMFFETYGHGRIVDLCKSRGWMLVAPRGAGFGGTPVAEIVDRLATIYPIDKKRVMLVGHSMGAAGAVGAAQGNPSRYAAVAALGGAGAVRSDPALKDLPFFVGVGTEDFALRGSRNLVASLKRAEVKNIEAREYPTIEHLAIVQVSLDDVFAFFDRSVKKTENP